MALPNIGETVTADSGDTGTVFGVKIQDGGSVFVRLNSTDGDWRSITLPPAAEADQPEIDEPVANHPATAHPAPLA